MNIESRDLRDEASQVYLEQVLVFDEMERLRLARGIVQDIRGQRGRIRRPRVLGQK